MRPHTARCLILACGNTLRSDDGVGPWLAGWAEERFHADERVRVISRQQWTPELAEEIAAVDSVLFIDCSIAALPGEVKINEVHAAASGQGLATHHQGAPELLAMAQELYGSLPSLALMLTIGAGSTELSEEFSEAVKSALPEACRQIECVVAG